MISILGKIAFIIVLGVFVTAGAALFGSSFIVTSWPNMLMGILALGLGFIGFRIFQNILEE